MRLLSNLHVKASPQYCQIVRYAGSFITLFTDRVYVSSNSRLSARMDSYFILISLFPLTSNIKKIYNTVASLEHFIIQILASAMLLLIAVKKALTEDVFIFPETPYTAIIICSPSYYIQAEWTSVLPNEDRRITLLEYLPRTLPGIESGTSTNCDTARSRMPCTFYNSRKI